VDLINLNLSQRHLRMLYLSHPFSPEDLAPLQKRQNKKPRFINNSKAILTEAHLIFHENKESSNPKNTLSIKPAKDFMSFRSDTIYVEIEDGRRGIFNLKPYLDFGVFRELRDVHYFNRVGILFGAVTWPHTQDIAPETLLAEMVPIDPNLSLTG